MDERERYEQLLIAMTRLEEGNKRLIENIDGLKETVGNIQENCRANCNSNGVTISSKQMAGIAAVVSAIVAGIAAGISKVFGG